MDDQGGDRTDALALGPEVDRLVVLGDPHGDVIALDVVLRLEDRPGTAFVSAGDNVGYADGVASSALCEILEKRGIRSVTGNHEAWSSSGRLFLPTAGGPPNLTEKALAWLLALPWRLRVTAAKAPDLPSHVVHCPKGWHYVSSENVAAFAASEDAAITFCGHTHRPAIYALRPGAKPVVRRLDPESSKPVEVPLVAGRRYVVDAGSLARPSAPRKRLAPERGTYAVLDLAGRKVSLHSIDKRPRIEELLRQLAERPDRPLV